MVWTRIDWFKSPSSPFHIGRWLRSQPYTLSHSRSPGIDLKCVSYVTTTDPVSSAWAAIHTSLNRRFQPLI
jgi:hypothetical protein